MKNYLDFKRQLEEKRLTAAEKKKREEIAQAIEKKNPDMPMDKKMAIATAQAKKIAEEAQIDASDEQIDAIANYILNQINEAEINEGNPFKIFSYGKKAFDAAKGLLGFGDEAKGVKSVEDILKSTPKPRTTPDDFRAPTDAYKPAKPAPDDPMGVQGPVVTKPFKDTDAAKDFTARELERIQKAVNAGKSADDFRAPPAMPKATPLKVEPPKAVDDIKPPPGTNKPTAANDDIKPPPPAPKKTQPRDERGRYVSSVPKSADDFRAPPAPKATGVVDDIKPPPAPKAPGAVDDFRAPSTSKMSLPKKIGVGVGSTLGAIGAMKALDYLTTNDPAKANATADDIKPPPPPKAAPTDDIKPPPPPKAAEAPKAPAIPTDDRARKEPAEPAPTLKTAPPELTAPKVAEPPKVEPAPAPEAPKADKPDYDGMTFGQAFNAARKAAGEKGVESTGRFTWKGKEYQTNVKGEKYVSRSKQTAVGESFDALPAGSIDEAILMSLTQVKK